MTSFAGCQGGGDGGSGGWGGTGHPASSTGPAGAGVVVVAEGRGGIVVADREKPRGPGTGAAGADGVVVDSSVCPPALRWAGDPEVAATVAALAAPAAASTTTATESNLRSPPDTSTGPLSRVAMARAERPLTVTDITG